MYLITEGFESLPLRLKGSHHMNVPAGIEIIFKMMSPILNEKARQRLKIHKTHQDLLNEVPEDSLPEEYGGTAGPLNDVIEYWAAKFIEYKPWIENELTYGTDESKREKKSKTQGSFRTLEID